MYRKMIKVVLVLLFTVTTFLFTAFPAFASTFPHINASFSPSSTIPQGFPPEQCLNTALQVNVVNSQTYTAILHVTNACGVPVNVSAIRFVTQQTDCAPFNELSKDFSTQLNDQQTAEVVQTVGAGCVVCINGRPVAFPSFNVRVTLFAFGSFKIGPNIIQATGNTSVANVVLSNNPHPFVPPCP